MAKRLSNGSITIKDIAAECGVSVSTVSNALNGKLNKVSKDVYDRILSVVEEKGYKPNYLAKNLRSLTTKTIGVIVEDLILFSTAPIVEGIMDRAEELGYNVVIENARLFGRWKDRWMRDEDLFQSALVPVLNKMNALHVDGIVYVGGFEHEVSIPYMPEGIPFAMVYAASQDKDIPSFRLDDEKGGYDVYKYLRSMGHKKIAIIAGESSNSHTVNRLRGIQRAMFEEQVLFDPSLVIYQTWNKEGGYKGMEALANEDITAVMCMSDVIASGAYTYLYEQGKRPGEDLAIIGYDNHEVSTLLYPQLSTVDLPLVKIGSEAVSWVIGNVEHDKDEIFNKDIRIAGKLIIRDSVYKI